MSLKLNFPFQVAFPVKMGPNNLLITCWLLWFVLVTFSNNVMWFSVDCWYWLFLGMFFCRMPHSFFWGARHFLALFFLICFSWFLSIFLSLLKCVCIACQIHLSGMALQCMYALLTAKHWSGCNNLVFPTTHSFYLSRVIEGSARKLIVLDVDD